VHDIALPGMLWGATLRSPHPHARVRSLRWKDGSAPEGVTLVTARDLPGPNGIQILDDTWPILADGVVRHVGEPVALVAAPTLRAAREALDRLEVLYEPLSPVLHWDEADPAEDLARRDLVQGDVDSALAESPIVVEGTYETGLQEHVYIETQGMIAWMEGDLLNVLGSMQCPYFVHKALAHALGLPGDRIRVRPAAVGGGFGGKEDLPSLLAVHAALLARAAGRPVKLTYGRHEDIIGSTKRHPSLIRHRTGVDAEGRLLAMDIEVLLDGGAYRTLSPVVLSRAVLHATGPYRCPAVRIRGRVIRTNTPPNGAFRGFGAPQVHFAAERQMDRIARRLGLDPYEIRRRNVLRPGDRLPTGQVLDDSASAHLCLEEAVRRTNFLRKWRRNETLRRRRTEEGQAPADDGRPWRGIGLSLYFHGAGFTGLGEHRMRSPVTVRLLPDGRIELLTAQTEMGQGAATVLVRLAAEAAGLSHEDVVLAEPDTSRVPDSGPTVASRTTMVVGEVLQRAVRQLQGQVLEWVLKAHGGKPPLRVRDGHVEDASGAVLGAFRDLARRYHAQRGAAEQTVRHEPPAWQVFDEESYHGVAYATYAWGADVVEVEVDPDTLEVRPLRATAVCEVGRVVHPILCRGQIEGGTLQAIGYALLEEMKTQRGHYLNDRLSTYMIPTSVDAPRIDVHLLERPWEGGPGGAKGVGELPMDGGAPATVQAVENATGLVPTRLPVTPERLLGLLLPGRAEAAPPPAPRSAAAASRTVASQGQGVVEVAFVLNGQSLRVTCHPLSPLLDILRDRIGLVGTKEGCREGECGACTVLLDGEPVLSCLVPILQCAGREVETIEGIASRGEAREMIRRFVAAGGVQCGACTPGIVVAAWRLTRHRKRVGREAIRRALAGNLCRCTGYEGILQGLGPPAAGERRRGK
jgi:CO/xanthine dehydrogenase Mo-binding subunit/aerobic-type carbon monoxide dehydrogenase small subunit (CoxS/CutS family)